MTEQQTIQWFPGHMARTEKQIAKDLKLCDAVVEILDARIPVSSRNPVLDRLIGQKPRILLLNRGDLADPEQTARWEQALAPRAAGVLAADCRSGKGLNKLFPLVTAALRSRIEAWNEKGMTGRKIRFMAVGIPNVGKSSLINRLAGGSRTAVENRPGVTRRNQWFPVGGRFEVLDTPGVLWPRIGDKTAGEHLAFTGAVKDEILDAELLACRLLETLGGHYAGRLAKRYRMEEAECSAQDGYVLLEKIGRKRGMLAGGGEVDTERAARMLLDEFRGGKIGRITLEWAK